jgi:signal transduction histidine kinase/response regulator RpfG family c-di-GMP phosphodiesterase
MRILLIGNEVEGGVGMRRLLAGVGVEVEGLVQVNTLEVGMRRMVGGEVDVAILDWDAGVGDIGEALAAVRTQAPSVPVVVLLRSDDGGSGREVVGLGAQDCLTRGEMTGPVLGRALEYAMERKRLELELVRAVDAARAVDRAKSAFLANMTHEIRTPLSGVLGMAGVLMETPLNGEQKEYVEVLRRSGEGLMQVINEVLEFSRIEAGRLVLEASEFDLRAVFEETVEPLALRAQEKELEFYCLLEPGTPRDLVGDAMRLRAMMGHLVSNAVKFTERGEIAVRLSGRRGVVGGVELRFEVMDTGCGVAVDRLPRLFDPFDHAQVAQQGGSGGTGLGLAITRHLARMMGGDVGVESTVGKGSRFWFTVVLSGADGVAGEGDEEGEWLRGWRLLVVEGNAGSRGVLAAYLRQYGAAVTEVERLGEAWAALLKAGGEGESFEAALVADRLPDGLPLDLIARIHQNPVLKGTVFVLLAPLARLGSVRVLRDLGIAAVVGKPVKQGDLLRALGAVRGGEAKARGAAGTGKREGRRRYWPGVGVLLVEDDATLQRVMRVMLERLGCTVVVVGNGQEALRMLRHAAFDLVLMDSQMPGQSGFEAVRAIRDSGSGVLRRDVPIVAMSATVFDHGAESRKAAGVDGFLAKPVRQEALAGVLEDWFGGGEEEREGGDAVREEGAVVEGRLVEGGRSSESGRKEADFDEAGFRETTLGDRGLGEQVIRLFLSQSVENIEALRAAVAIGDAMVVSQRAHSLNGNAAQVGGAGLRMIARQMEEASRRGDLSLAGASMADLEAAHRRLCQRLREHIGDVEKG